jgi:hypothetical protein
VKDALGEGERQNLGCDIAHDVQVERQCCAGDRVDRALGATPPMAVKAPPTRRSPHRAGYLRCAANRPVTALVVADDVVHVDCAADRCDRCEDAI